MKRVSIGRCGIGNICIPAAFIKVYGPVGTLLQAYNPRVDILLGTKETSALTGGNCRSTQLRNFSYALQVKV